MVIAAKLQIWIILASDCGRIIKIFLPNGLSVEWRFIWRSKLASFAKTLKQTLQMNILTPSWILPCDVRSTDVVNACPQTWQMNGLRSLWYRRCTMNWYLKAKTFPQMSQVCMPGDGIVDESSFDDVVAHVAIDELLFVTFDAVLTAPELDTGGLPIFSIFGIINGVVCAGAAFVCWIELVGAMGGGCDCAFDTGTEALTGGTGIAFDVAGNVCSEFPIFPNTSWYVKNWLISSMFTWTICPSALRTSNICDGGSLVSDKICGLLIACDGKW